MTVDRELEKIVTRAPVEAARRFDAAMQHADPAGEWIPPIKLDTLTELVTIANKAMTRLYRALQIASVAVEQLLEHERTRR